MAQNTVKKDTKIESTKPSPLKDVRVVLADERFTKIGGLLMMLSSLYLAIAFVSYLFTWEQDQSEVKRLSWSVLGQSDFPVSNWLGKLGAIVSHQFIYCWFGLSSFVFVFLLLVGGLAVLYKTPRRRLYPLLKKSMLLTVWASVAFAFIFQRSAFPWGGAFGEAIVAWCSSFLGLVGMASFLMFTLISYLVWLRNPNFKDLSYDKVQEDILGSFNSRNYRINPSKLSDFFKASPEDDGRVPERQASKTERQSTKPATVVPLDETAPADKGRRAVPPPLTTATIPIDQEINLGSGHRSPVDVPSSLKPGDAMLEIEDLTMPPKERKEEVVPLTGTLPFAEDLVAKHGLYDPTRDLPAFESPVLSLLENYDAQNIVIDRAELEANKDQIIQTLLHYRIEITKIKATVGPTVTLYEIIPAPGVRISKIKNLEDDIALSLAALGIRIIAPIPGKGTIGIEVPNKNKQVVALKSVLADERFRRAEMELPIVLGRTISNEVYVADLTRMPHLLIAGATGQGKSVGVNTILMSLLYKKHPSQLKLVLIDPKKVELSLYSKLTKHYLALLPDEGEPIITDTSRVVSTLQSLTTEMDERYNLLKKANVRNLLEYNEKFVNRKLNPENGHRFLPYIVLVIDEFADLIMTAGKEIELPIGRLAQLARAVGIHLIIATQRPSVNIITGVIKANFPARMAFKVASKIDSRTILDTGGAEQLIGRGDMLVSFGGGLVRIQGAFVDTPEVEKVMDFIAEQPGYADPYMLPDGLFGESATEGSKTLEDIDEFFAEAARLMVATQQGSTSMIQRRMKLGFNRAGRIMDQLEAAGIVGSNEGSKPREVLFQDEAELERYLSKLLAK